MFTSALHSWHLSGKRVFLRADLNVPLAHGTILDDFKIQALIPTLQLLLEKKGKVILATHIDRPDHPQPELSTRHLLPWFTRHGYPMIFCETLEQAQQASKEDSKNIALLENLRFFPDEKSPDLTFAHELKKLADYYVNDAFGTLHRTDCSVYALPQLYSTSQKTFGLLIEKELNNAQKLLTPAHPFCLIMGGNKAADKLPFIYHMLPKIDSLLLCPEIDHIICHEGKTIISYAKKHRIAIEAPDDYVVGKSLENGPFVTKTKENVQPGDFPVCIGPETQKKYAHLIAQSATVFYNGLMGTVQNMQTLQGVHALFTAMQQCRYAVVAGGDSTAAARLLGFEKSLHLSTGGGALLAYVSGQKLPALEVLIDRAKS